jgi:TPR repeat protein
MKRLCFFLSFFYFLTFAHAAESADLVATFKSEDEIKRLVLLAKDGNSSSFLELKAEADIGNVLAQRIVGGFYSYGYGLPKDKELAAKYYLLAAERGDSMSQYNIGLWYLKGEVLGKSINEGFRFLRLASNQGLVPAHHGLAVLYENGIGVIPDKNEALRLYKLAADSGDEKAKIEFKRLNDLIAQEVSSEGPGKERQKVQSSSEYARKTDISDQLDVERLASLQSELVYRDYRDAYAKATTSERLSAFIAEYEKKDPDNLVVLAKKRLPTLQKQELENRLQEEKKFKHEQEVRAKKESDELQRSKLEDEKKTAQYINRLRQKHYSKIFSSSTEAMSIVSLFNIDCRTSSHKYIPLLNILFFTADQVESMGAQVKYFVEKRGGQVRIYEEILKNGRSQIEPKLKFEINEWGELRPFGISPMALLTPCGSTSPEHIWKIAAGAGNGR